MIRLPIHPPGSFKIYSILINQTGTNDPTTTILNNQVGNITWTRNDTGIYVAELTGAFKDAEKIQMFPSNTTQGSLIMQMQVISDNQIELRTDVNGIGTDGLLNDTPIIIKIHY